jgi:tetratricopeptide (TPR) repeat protein
MVETLVSGREAIQRRAWNEAAEAFAAADQQEGLSPEDLELLAEAAWWSGDPDRAVDALERAFSGYEDAGSRSAAALVAIRLGYLALRRMAVAIGSGWLGRAERLLEQEPESVAHAWLKMLYLAEALFVRFDIEQGLNYAEQAIELGEKHHSADVRSLALSFKGMILIHHGRWKEGIALIDEASAAAGSGRLDPRWASDI